MRSTVERCLVSALALVAIVAGTPRTAAAGTISIDTKFQGVVVGYQIEGDFFPGPIGSAQMSNAQGLGIDSSLTFDAYCVDLFTDIFDPGTTTQTVPVTVNAEASPMSIWADPGGRTLNGPGAGSKVAYLYEQFAAGATGDNLKRTALTAAIWNVLYDTDNSVSNGQGTFYLYCDSTAAGFTGCDPNNPTSGAVVSAANGYLSQLASADPLAIASSSAVWLRLTASDGDIQDFVGPAGLAATAVPEPATCLLLGTGLFALRGRRRA